MEYVKQWLPNQIPIALVHVGKNQFYTEVYWPDVRKHRFDIADSHGKLRKGAKVTFNIAGPLCFQGDYLGWIHLLFSGKWNSIQKKFEKN